MNLKEEILSRTNQGLEVFGFYMPIDFVPKRNFRNPLYDDLRDSCNIYLDPKTQCYRMKDFGNDMYSGDRFWFAASMLGLDVKTDFPRLLEQIVEDLHLNISKQERHSPHKAAPTPHQEEVSHKQFKLYVQAFSIEELRFWGRYGITGKTLERYNVHSLARYESVSSQGKPFALHSTADEPMFAYVLGDFVKLYSPVKSASSMVAIKARTISSVLSNCRAREMCYSLQEAKKMYYHWLLIISMLSASIVRRLSFLHA